jgi:hypothetical protein
MYVFIKGSGWGMKTIEYSECYQTLTKGIFIEVCSNETCSRIVLGEGIEAIKNCLHGGEASIPLTYPPMNPLHKDLPGLLVEPLHHHGLDVFLQSESTTLQHFLDGDEYMEVTL